MKNLIISAARKAFGDVFTKDDFVVAHFKVQDYNYRCVFHESDRIVRARLFPLMGVDPIVVPPDRRDAVLQYFGAVNTLSHISDGWLKLHPDGEICCQAEVVIASSVEDLDELLPMMTRNAGRTLGLWWPGLAEVINKGIAPSIAFLATREKIGS